MDDTRTDRGPTRCHRVRRWAVRAQAVVAAGAVVTVLTAGVAVASWTTGGSGSGTATAGTTVALTSNTTTASTASLLYPNGPAADLRLTVINSNPFPVSVTALAVNGSPTATGGIGVCVTTGVSLVVPMPGLPIAVPAKVGATNGTVTVTLAGAAQMSGAAETGCQNATFTIPVTMTAVSAAP